MLNSFYQAEKLIMRSLTPILVIGGLLMGGCSQLPDPNTDPCPEPTPAPTPAPEPSGPNYADETYMAAVNDAMIAELDEEFDGLWLPNDAEKGLFIREVEGVQQVRVSTWTTENPYQDYQIGGSLVPSEVWDYAIWVTLEPQVQSFCQSWSPESGEKSLDTITLRVEQGLGLPPGAGKAQFVSMWVNMDDLARPCLNPDPMADECSPFSLTEAEMEAGYASGYLQWFQKNSANSYRTAAPYPWTRLGYTLDWAPGAEEIGFTEFLVKPGASIEVVDIQSTGAYCGLE